MHGRIVESDFNSIKAVNCHHSEVQLNPVRHQRSSLQRWSQVRLRGDQRDTLPTPTTTFTLCAFLTLPLSGCIQRIEQKERLHGQLSQECNWRTRSLRSAYTCLPWTLFFWIWSRFSVTIDVRSTASKEKFVRAAQFVPSQIASYPRHAARTTRVFGKMHVSLIFDEIIE